MANFESLGFKLGQAIVRRKNPPSGPMAWDTPKDHTIRLDYYVLKALVRPSLEKEKVWGKSLLFGLNALGHFLNKMPRFLTGLILNLLNLAAGVFTLMRIF